MTTKKDKRYEKIYERVRAITSQSIKELERSRDGGVIVAGAQAEALVRTLKGFTLRTIKKEYHAEYLHHLLSGMLKEVLDGLGHLDGRIVIMEKRQKK
jgi:hypothetical protein